MTLVVKNARIPNKCHQADSFFGSLTSHLSSKLPDAPKPGIKDSLDHDSCSVNARKLICLGAAAQWVDNDFNYFQHMMVYLDYQRNQHGLLNF